MIDEKKLVKIVGAGNVSHDRAILEEYSRDMSFVNTIKPDYVVKPRNGDDIAKLVKLANETLTPLVPVSSGPPHFRGDTVPGTGGAVIVDLTKMKKVIRVDRAHRVAMVEPGVTFGELIPAVEKEGLRLNMPLLPRKSKTVVGSMLEREPVVMPKYQWDISDPLACVEVVFGSGEMFRTGQAAGPGTIEEQWAAGGAQKTPYGPGPAQWNRLIQGAQGTMGIVTWASLRCELLPKLEEPFLVGSSDLNKLFELVHWLIRLRLVNECLVLNNSNLAAIMAKKWPGDYADLKDSSPPWVLFFNVAGYDYFPEDRVSSQIKGISDITNRIGVEAVRAVGRVSAAEMLKTVRRPSDEPYWKLRYKGACHDIFFITTYDKLEGQISVMYELANEFGYPASDMGIYLQPIVQGANCHCEFNLFYDPQNPGELNHVEELSAEAVNVLMATGAFFSRPYDKSARMIVNRDAAYVEALTRVKEILDPNRVMNPGKLCF
ncbi:MAG: FAD-binding oxidoreductase [Dehalococcoidales bacterium]|nr:FAD-binding oxidoreductase [Dehalococcoidales bacterium]